MRKFALLSTSAIGSAAFFGLAFAAPAYAQPVRADCTDEEVAAGTCQRPAETADDEPAPGEQVATVTGSRIRRPNLDSTVPITSVAAEDLTETADVSIGDNLNDLPSLRSTFGSANSTRFIGTAGLNLLDLRGLGTARTLVLVNNRRHVTASPGDYLVDVNTIPTTLLERVDIVTGGNSAIYGSDAVAGVVNFILRRDFDGIEGRAQAGISDEGDLGQYFVGLTAGRNFLDDRANVAVSFEYTKQQPLYFVDRPGLTGAFDGRCQFNVVDPLGAAGGETGVSNSDGIPDRQFICGVRNNALSTGGTIGTFGAGNAIRFRPDGTLFIDTPEEFFPAAPGFPRGGQGATLRDTGQLAAGIDRYAANLLARVEISPALQPFLEAKYVHIDAIQEGQPSFWQGSIPGFFGGGTNLRCNNPFLTAQALTTLQSFGICTNVAAGVFAMSRFNVDFGGRGELHDRDTYRVVAGVEGDFNDDWHYEIAANYGVLETNLRSLNNLVLFDLAGNPDGFLLALDAQRNAAGQIVCGVNNDAITTNDRPDCVPINVFGFGAPSQAALDFVNTTGTRDERATQLQLSAFMSGDLSQLFELPGGPIGFALGAEYRRETARSEFDELTASGGTFLNAIQPFNPPNLTVKEVFGEIRLPLLRDLPFAQELTLEAAARYSDYNIGNTDTTFAYNLGGTWSPIRDIRFRANYSQSVRVPTQSDLFSPQSQNFAFIADPCDAQNIGVGNRAANCAAGNVPTTANQAVVDICATSPTPIPLGAPWINCLARAFSTAFLSGGNPTLEEETGRSWTVGAVIQPRFVPGLSITVDYYNIDVEDLIAVLSAQTIINECYGSAQGINNPFCATVSRDPATGFFNDPAVVSGGVNFARQKTEGIDAEIAYRHTFDNGHRLSVRAIGTYVLTLDNYTNPTFPDAPNRQRSELGDPVFGANLNMNYDFGAFDLSYRLRYIGRQTINTYEAQHEFRGVCTATYVAAIGCTLNEITTLPPLDLDSHPRVWYPDVFYHSVRLGYEVNERFSFYGGVDNITDRLPPLGLLGTAGGDPFDSVGRTFYVGVNVDFR